MKPFTADEIRLCAHHRHIHNTPGLILMKHIYSKSPTYEQVPFQERTGKSNLFVSPTKLA